MCYEGQCTAFTRAIVQYFIITTFTGAVGGTRFTTGTEDKAKPILECCSFDCLQESLQPWSLSLVTRLTSDGRQTLSSKSNGKSPPSWGRGSRRRTQTSENNVLESDWFLSQMGAFFFFCFSFFSPKGFTLEVHNIHPGIEKIKYANLEECF